MLDDTETANLTKAGVGDVNAEPIQLLEQRIMLDATLDWDIGVINPLDALTTLSNSFSEYVDQFDTIFGDLTAAFDTAMTGAESLFELVDGAPDTGVGNLDDMLQRVKSAVDGVQGFFSDEFTALLDAQAANFATNMTAYIAGNYSATGTDTTTPGDFANYFADVDIKDIFGPEAFLAGDVATRMTAFADAAGIGDSAQVVDLAQQAFGIQITGGFINNLLSVELTDVAVGGETLIAFTNGTGGEVHTQVNLPTIDTILDALAIDPDLRMALPEAFSFVSPAESFSFDITPISTAAVPAGGGSGAVPANYGILFDSFTSDPLFVLDGSTTFATPPELRLGLLQGELNSIDTAEIGLFFDDLSTLQFGLTVDIDPGLALTTIDPIAGAFDMDLQIKEIGTSAFASIVAGTAYDLIAFDIDGTLSLSSTNAADTLAYGLGITVSSPIKTAGGGQTIESLLAGVDLAFDVTLPGITDPAERALAEELVNALFNTGPDQIGAFLANMGTGISDFLRSEFLNIGIPMTDFNLSDGFRDIADFFSSLPEQFGFAASSLGFNADIDLYELAPDIPGQDSANLSGFQLDYLASLGTITFEVLTPNANPEIAPSLTPMVIDFSSLTPTLPGGALDPNFLSQFASLMNTQLNTIGWSVTTADGKLKFLSNTGGAASNKLFRVESGTLRAGGATTSVLFSHLGFGGDKLRTLDIDGVGTFPVLNISVGIPSFDLGAFDLASLDGLTSFRLNVTTDSGTQEVDVNSSAATGWADLSALFADMNATFTNLSIDMTAGFNAANNGIGLTLDAGATGSISLGVDLGSLTRALDLNSLMDWINSEIAAVVPGAELTLADNGDLIFSLPDVTGEFSVGTGDPVAFNASDLGLGDLAGLNLGANLAGSISGGLSVAVGVNIVDVVTDFLNSGDPEVTRTSAFLDNTFITDLAVTAELEAEASSITGGADLGLAEITIGGVDPTQNFIKLDGQFDSTIVGQTNGTFSDRITLSQLLSLGQNFVSGASGPGTSVTDLLGRMDLIGGILTDESGMALNVGGTKATTVGDVQVISNAAQYTLGAGEELSFLYVSMGDVALDVGAVGIGAGVEINGIDFSVGNIFDILDQFAINIDAPALNGLFDLQSGDIFDALAGVGDMLVAVGEMFADQFAFFDVEIPLMNFSLLDALDFSSDFLDALRDLRLNPDFNLTTIEDFLEGIFGLDTITLDWDSALNMLNFDLNLDFLTDFDQTLAFNFDLASLLGAQLDGLIGPDLAEFLTGFVDARGDGALVFDPDLFFNFSFGIDLSTMNLQLNNIAALNTDLSDLATVFGISLNGPGQDDLRIKWNDLSSTLSQTVNVDLDGATTLQDALNLINAELLSSIGPNVTASYDLTTGELKITDTNTSLTDDAGVNITFGAASLDSDGTGNPYGIVDLIAGVGDFANAATFDIIVGDADPVTVSLDADAARTTSAAYIEALNLELSELSVKRSKISSSAVPGATVALSQLLRFEDVGGQLQLHGTNFADINGYDPVTFTVLGEDISHDIEFVLEELGQSNAARLLGFKPDVIFVDEAVSKPIYNSPTLGRPVVFMDTTATEIRGEITVGAPDGLNLTLALGPLEASVVDGQAYIGASTGNGDAGYISLGVNDIDGVNNGQYDLSHLADIGDDPALEYLDLFNLDVDLAIIIDLPFSGGAGLLDPALHGFTYESLLVKTLPGLTLANFDPNNLGGFFDGDLIDLYIDGQLDLDTPPAFRNFSLDLPDFADFFANFNVLDFLNDPRAVLGGLEMIMKTIQGLYDDYLADINLPLIGDSLAVGVNFFDTFRFDFIEPALAYVETPDANGNLPTTVDVVNGYLNDLLNDFVGTTGETYIQAALDTSGALEDSYLYGAISLSEELFSKKLDIDFDFGVPGLDIGVDEGSAIRLVADYAINLGFGIDKNGFFLLNDTTDQEISIGLTVDANDFEGSMNVLGVLGLEAFVDQATGGIAEVTASLGADLFGTAGTDLGRDYSGITLIGGAEFENTVYIPQIDQSQLIAFSFIANASVDISLTAMLTDPTTGNELEIGGASIIPRVMTDFVFAGSFDSALDESFQLTSLGFMDVSVDASTLYETLLAPILDPIEPILGPLTDLFDWLNEPPMLYAKQALQAAFPIFGLVDTIAQLVGYMDQLVANNGIINFGDFDFTAMSGDVSNGDAKLSDMSGKDASRNTSGATAVDGSFSGTGLSIEIPLLTDPFAAINLLLGKFDQVDLVTAEFTLFDADFSIDPVQQLLDAIGAPGWVSDIIRTGLSAHIDLELHAGFKVGYDLSGIVNFMNTYDPVRLLDGVFIDSNPGALVYASVDGYISLNAGIAGLDASIGGYVSLTFNDPNADGKLRIPELIALVEAGIGSGDPIDFLGFIFDGEAGFNAYLRLWAGINLPWPLPDLKWSTTLFNINESTTFGGFTIPPKIATLTNGTSMLNIGAAAGGNMSTIDTDGDDRVVISGTSVAFSSNGRSLPAASLPAGTGGIVIPAGNGNNYIDLSGLGGSGSTPTITYTGDGKDTIILPSSGVHVIFAGAGSDTITATGNANATYIVFAEEGADNINIVGGNTVIISGDDFGMRETFLAEFAQGGVTEARILDLIGINRDGTAKNSGLAKYDTGDTSKSNLVSLMNKFTAETQLNAQDDDEIISLTTGNHIVLTGNGQDEITVLGNSNSGVVKVMAGGDDDQIFVTAGTTLVEGGAGEDLMVLGNGNNEAYGWGKQGELAGVDLSHLMRMDGDDIIIGANGNDQLFGQYGKDIISGGLGNDTVDGGRDNDVLSGGVLKITYLLNNVVTTIDLTLPGALALLQTTITVETEDLADGIDTVRGQNGMDVLFGGGGDDNLNGGLSADILIGDFGKIDISANRIAQTFTSTNFTSLNAGSDTLEGAEGDDILVAGGSVSPAPEVITDLQGNNTVFGDFGVIEGTRILEEASAYRTIASAFGTIDHITTGGGNDVIFGGEFADIINAGMGADIVFGDLGEYVVARGELSTFVDARDGADQITVGDVTKTDDKMDIVLGGGGGDTVTSGDGALVLLGDYGTMKLNPIAVNALLSLEPLAGGASQEDIDFHNGQLALIGRLFENMASVPNANAGGDTLNSVDGTTYAILGGGGDTATLLGSSLGYVLGDDGRIAIARANSTDPATITMETAASSTAGADTISTGSARDVVIGGDAGDTINTGEGLGIIMGDSGVVMISDEEDALPISMITTQSAGDGVDGVTTGSGIDFAILGGAGDTANMGDGVNYVLADDGSILVTGAGPATVTMESMSSTNGGVDTVTTGLGRDTVIGGDLGDTIHLGEGNNAVLGDSGKIIISENQTTPTEMSSIASIGDGADTVTSGAGIDLAILGLGGDNATLGDGNNRAIGDSGIIRTSGALGDEYMESTDPANGGGDTITTGTGHDIVMGGEGMDIVTTNEGFDILVGDNAIIQKAGSGGLHTLRSLTGDYGDDDQLLSGDGNDILVGGLGGDTMTVGNGEDVALGDLGDVDFRNITDVVRVAITRDDAGGDDIITAAGTTGDNILIGQVGADTITGGESDDWIIGDLAEITLTDPATALPGQSVMDRVSFVNFINPDLGFDDILSGGAGNDFILGGFGDDTLNGGDGQDFLMGDSIRFYRDVQAGPPVYEEIRLETTYAYVTGGYDTMNGGDGADVMVGNLGPDLFIGNTADDALFSDGFAGIFGATLVDGFASTVVHRELITANFAGSGALDIVSNAQIDQAIGVYLSTATVLEAIEESFASNPFGAGSYESLAVKSGQLSFDELSAASTFFSSSEVIRHLAELILLDVDADLAKEDILRLFRLYMIEHVGSESPMQLTIFNKMMDKLLESLEAEGSAVYNNTIETPAQPVAATATL